MGNDLTRSVMRHVFDPLHWCPAIKDEIAKCVCEQIFMVKTGCVFPLLVIDRGRYTFTLTYCCSLSCLTAWEFPYVRTHKQAPPKKQGK